jgi:Na+/melibiose symporter-like transporter
MLPQVDELIRILQVAIGPVVLISGVGLLILSMTNRLSHMIDRIRALHVEIKKAGGDDKGHTEQLEVLFKRSRLIRNCLMMFVLSILLDAMMVIMLFFIKLMELGAAVLIAILFSLSLLCMIAGLVFFIIDVAENLRALKIEVGKT